MGSERGRRFSRLSWKDRLKMNKMLKEKRTVQEIADALHVHNSTIYRERKRGLTVQRTTDLIDREVYCPETAQRKYEEHLQGKGPDLKIGNDHALAEYIEDKIIREKCSPAAALAKIEEEGKTFSTTISEWTVYSYIDKGIFRRLTNKSLPMRGKKKQTYRKVRAARPPKGDSIEERPKGIETREELGNWEMDTVVSAKGSARRLLVLTERKTRMEIIMLMENGKAESVVSALDAIERRMGPETFRRVFASITVDNGSEFQDCEGMQRGGRTHIYYCHPYSAYERGTNENINRMIRRWFPKGTNFSKLTEAEVTAVERWINSYPRGILGNHSANWVFRELAPEAGLEGVQICA